MSGADFVKGGTGKLLFLPIVCVLAIPFTKRGNKDDGGKFGDVGQNPATTDLRSLVCRCSDTQCS